MKMSNLFEIFFQIRDNSCLKYLGSFGPSPLMGTEGVRSCIRMVFSGFSLFLPPRRTFSLFERCSTSQMCA